VPTEPLRCVGALIVDDDDGRRFLQRRSPERSLFPNAWDIGGGQLEPGETAVAAPRSIGR
jgi:8-oxo-dGTP pyrophosphatase MutT (NUDIX family)